MVNDVSTIDLLAVELTRLQRLYYYECCAECSQQKQYTGDARRAFTFVLHTTMSSLYDNKNDNDDDNV